MTIFLEQPRRPSSVTIAGGEAGLADIAGAGRDSLLYVDNSNSSHAALDRAISDRIERIHQATGTQYTHPLRAAEDEWRRQQTEQPRSPLSAGALAGRPGPKTFAEIAQEKLDRFEGDLFGLGEKFPDARQAIGADRPLIEDAKRIARDADARLGQLLDSRGGIAKWGALLAGGMAGALNDPITIGSLVVGGGPGAARTIAGRILTVAGKEAMINAGAEAAIQPSVQAWREKAGLDHGMDEAIRNVLFAGAIGGAFGVAGQGIAEAARPFIRDADIDRAAQAISGNERLADNARALLEGDGLRAAESMAEIRTALPAEARGALDQAEIIRVTDAQRPQRASVELHDQAVTQADRMIRMPDVDQFDRFPVDEAQIARVTREIVGEDVSAPIVAERSLTGFLIDRGGISDFQGELRAIGADQVSERFRGRLTREDGESLDYAREAAAQAGYFDRLYGTPDEAAARSTVADLLDLLEEDIRGNPVTPGMAVRSDAGDFEAARAGVEGIVAQIARFAGPSVDDAVIARAARLALEHGEDPAEAFMRTIMDADFSPRPRSQQADELPPGWSDEELLAASERRGLTAEPDGIADPAIVRPVDEISPADIETFRSNEPLVDSLADMMVDDAGNVVPISRYMETIARDAELADLIKACRA